MHVKKNKISARIVFGVAILMSFGCVQHYPMGLSQIQWESLPPNRQAEYQAQQYELDEQRRQAAEARRLARELARQEALVAERARVARLYEQADYGDIVRVIIQGGYLEVYGKRYPAQPVAFELVKGERKEISIKHPGRTGRSFDFPVRLSEDGNSFFFDDSGSAETVIVNCNWERGQDFVQPPAKPHGSGARLMGATFFIKYKESSDRPARIIIENRN